MSVEGKKVDNYKPKDLGEIKLIHFHSQYRGSYRLDHEKKPIGMKTFPADFDPSKNEPKIIYGTETNEYYELMKLVPASFNNPNFNIMAIFDSNRPIISLPDKIEGKIIVKNEDRVLVLDKNEEWVYAFIEDSDKRFIREHIISEKKK
jgi:hypothetical protein